MLELPTLRYAANTISNCIVGGFTNPQANPNSLANPLDLTSVYSLQGDNAMFFLGGTFNLNRTSNHHPPHTLTVPIGNPVITLRMRYDEWKAQSGAP